MIYLGIIITSMIDSFYVTPQYVLGMNSYFQKVLTIIL